MSDNNGSTHHGTENVSRPLKIVIGERLKQLAPLSASCCIYKVPEDLRCLNPTAYTPKLVSIGPLHHGKETLQDMEEYKYRYLQHFLHRTKENLEYYIQKIRDQEAELRGHYAESIKLSSDDFVTIILVDSAFIIELLLKNYLVLVGAESADHGDRITSNDNFLSQIVLDLFLLENQLPLFILEDLYDPGKAGDSPSIVQLSRDLFGICLQDIGVDNDSVAVNFSEVSLPNQNSSEVKVVHFLDIARNLCLPVPPPDDSVKKGNKISIRFDDGIRKITKDAGALTGPSITELHRAGIKLKAVKSTTNLFKINFQNGILEIPKVIISGSLELTFRNLAAFEQCHYPNNARIAGYLCLLDCFVDTPKDVELLVKYGIVTNLLGNSIEACSMINRLSQGLYVSFDDFDFAGLYDNLHEHCKRPWNKWKANLRQNYLNTPWRIVSVVAAAILLLLTIMQAVCSLVSLLV